jgi:hypothetical protein
MGMVCVGDPGRSLSEESDIQLCCSRDGTEEKADSEEAGECQQP